jgi:hypothetical protein
LPHDLEIVTVTGGESRSQYHTPLDVGKFTGKQKKIKYCYFIATPRIIGIFYHPHKNPAGISCCSVGKDQCKC